MSSSVTGIISKNTTLQSIKEYMDDKFSSVRIKESSSEDYFTLFFNDSCSNDLRTLSVFFGEISKHDFNIDGVCISLGEYGNAKKIIKGIVNHFGGYYRENYDSEFIQVCIEKFTSDKVSEKAAFINKIISRLGYDNLSATLELFSEYHEIFNKKPIEMIQEIKQGHYESEDCWYSCPMSGECCNDDCENECNCGADETNENIDKIIKQLR